MSAMPLAQVELRARNELQPPVQWEDQREWIKLSAQVLNVSDDFQLLMDVELLLNQQYLVWHQPMPIA